MTHEPNDDGLEARELLADLAALVGRLSPGDREDEEMLRWALGELAELTELEAGAPPCSLP